MSTGQSDFLSPQNKEIYCEREHKEQLKRKETFTDLRLKVALGMKDLDEPIKTEVKLASVTDAYM